MQGIEIPIGAPLGKLNQDLDGAQQALKGFTVAANGDLLSIGKSLGTLERQLKVFKDGIKNSTDPSRILLLNNAIKATEAQLVGTKNAINGVGFNKFSTGSNQAAFALTNLGRVAQDAPFGFIGIQNNLNPLLESFQQLRAQNTSLGATFKALGQSLIGPAGLGIALSLVTAAITFYTQYQQKAKRETEEVTESFKKQKDEFLKSPYEKAVIELSDLTTKVSLAKQGFLDKKSVLKEYNDSIGKTIGKVTDLNSAEQALINNGDKYLQLMLLKAKAEFAFKKAAEASYDITKKQSEIEVNKNPLELDAKGLAALAKLGKKPITAISITTEFDEQRELKKLNTFANRAVNIAKTAEQEVIDFAKKSGFNLNSLFDIDTDKLKGDVKTVEDILKALDIDKKQIGADLKLLKSGQFIEEAKVIQKAINDLIGIGVKTDSGIIKKLQQDLINIDQSGLLISGKQLGLNLIQGVKEGVSGIGGQVGTQMTEDMAEGFARGAPVIAKTIGNSLKLPLTDFQIYVNEQLLPKLQTNFETFFNDILMNGKLSFDSLGKALINTLLSVVASDAARQVTSLLKTSSATDFTDSKKTGGGGILGAAFGLLKLGKKAAPVVTTAATTTAATTTAALAPAAAASPLLPILAGVAAVALVANLFKKKQQTPIPQASSTISTSAAGSAQDFGGGRVVFEISGTNLIGVLNRAGAKLQRFGP
jgi:hypothetical protein